MTSEGKDVVYTPEEAERSGIGKSACMLDCVRDLGGKIELSKACQPNSVVHGS